MLKEVFSDALNKGVSSYLILFGIIFLPLIINVLLSLNKGNAESKTGYGKIVSIIVFIIIIFCIFSLITFDPDSTWGYLGNLKYYLIAIVAIIYLVIFKFTGFFTKSLADSQYKNLIIPIVFIIIGYFFISPIIANVKENKSLEHILSGGYHYIDAKVSEEYIYFIDYEDDNSYLSRVNHKGNDKKVIVEMSVSEIDGISDESIYFTSDELKYKYMFETDKILELDEDNLEFDSTIHKYNFYRYYPNFIIDGKDSYYQCEMNKVCKNNDIIYENDNYDIIEVIGKNQSYLFLVLMNDGIVSKIIKYDFQKDIVVNEMTLNENIDFTDSDYTDTMSIIISNNTIYKLDFNTFEFVELTGNYRNFKKIYLYDNTLVLIHYDIDPTSVTFIDLNTNNSEYLLLSNETLNNFIDFDKNKMYYLDKELKEVNLDTVFN